MITHVVTVAALAAASIHPCSHYFRPRRTEADARAIFRSSPTKADLRRLGHKEACLTIPNERGRVVRYDRHQAALRRARLERLAREEAAKRAAAIHIQATTPVQPTPSASTTTTTSSSSSSLVNCIIQHESGGNPQATNGQYGGIGQWNPAAWAQDGGTRYAPTPTGASYSQQLSVLQGEGAAGQYQQQGQYDGCG